MLASRRMQRLNHAFHKHMISIMKNMYEIDSSTLSGRIFFLLYALGV